jgi:hypothetical protein
MLKYAESLHGSFMFSKMASHIFTGLSWDLRSIIPVIQYLQAVIFAIY